MSKVRRTYTDWLEQQSSSELSSWRSVPDISNKINELIDSVDDDPSLEQDVAEQIRVVLKIVSPNVAFDWATSWLRAQ